MSKKWGFYKSLCTICKNLRAQCTFLSIAHPLQSHAQIFLPKQNFLVRTLVLYHRWWPWFLCTFRLYTPLQDHCYLLYTTIFYTGITAGETVFLTTSAAIIIIASTFYLVVKVYQLYWRKPRPQFRDITGLKYVYEETLDYLHQHHRAILNDMHSIALYLCVIIFVFPVGHECWCFPSWKWQIGALAIFMAWINNFILLKDIPHFGIPITRLFNVYLNFILLIYLPILLIMTFAFPFYMLFIATLEVSD